MTIEQKAREIAERCKGVSVIEYPTSEEVARLGIIEGLEMAAKVADEIDTGYFDARTFTAQKIASAIRALIEEQKL